MTALSDKPYAMHSQREMNALAAEIGRLRAALEDALPDLLVAARALERMGDIAGASHTHAKIRAARAVIAKASQS